MSSVRKTEVRKGAYFGGAQLDKRRLVSTEGRDCETLTQRASPHFPTHQEEHIHLCVSHQRERDQKSEVLSYDLDPNLVVGYENDGLLGNLKRMGLAGGKAKQSYFWGIISVI